MVIRRRQRTGGKRDRHPGRGRYETLLPSPGIGTYWRGYRGWGLRVPALQKEPGKCTFIDIGTNGEIVLESHGRLLCCSAPQVLRWKMNISSGMRAAEGAVEDVRITEKGIELATIDNQEPAGICGSGILAVVKESCVQESSRRPGRLLRRTGCPSRITGIR